ncbi:hypothetical protein AB395_00002763 [Sinorhizobium fredii CCBAU 45436]|nr:hypothetical protein AB395_00002763 [Sinorhizobium fredii CCBAU 45436]
MPAARADSRIGAPGALVYNGYGDVIRRVFLKHHDDPRHPEHV